MILMSVSYLLRQEPDSPTGLDKDNQSLRNQRAWPSPPDPGDLGKRVARRRAELHLSKAQVLSLIHI